MKRGPARDKKYMEWIRQRPCAVTNERPDWGTVVIHAHHVTVNADRGLGQKPSDYWCIPLTAEQHDLLHRTGERTYWERRELNPHRIAGVMMMAYLEDQLDLNPRLILQHLELLMENYR